MQNDKRRNLFSSPARRDNFFLSLGLMLPTILIVLIIAIYPLIKSFDISLRYFNLMKPEKGTPYVWLRNYQFVLTDQKFWRSVRSTAIFTILSVALVLFFALAIALLLNRRFPGKNFVQALMLVPWAVPGVANGLIWLWILNPSYGALNGLLSKAGIIDQYIVWLGDQNWAMTWVILAETWKETPFIMLIILAALQTIPQDLYEAARVDGASSFQSLIRITLPMIKPTFFVALTLRTIWAIKSFDLIYTLTSGGPADATNVIGYYTYQKAFVSMNLGRGSAAVWLMTLVMIILTIFYQRALIHGEA